MPAKNKKSFFAKRNTSSAPKNSKTRILQLVGLGGFIVLVLFFFIFNSSSNMEKTRSEREINVLKDTFTQRHTYLKTLRKDKKELEQLTNNLEKANQSLLKRNEVSEALDEITQMGERNRLKFLSFKPTQIESYTFYNIQPVQIAISGNYHDILRFIDSLNHLNHLAVINKFSMIISQGAEQSIHFNFVLLLYYQAPPKPNTPSKGAKNA